MVNLDNDVKLPQKVTANEQPQENKQDDIFGVLSRYRQATLC